MIKETPDARIVRLAQVARERGIQVYQELSTGAWFATSASRPGTAHYLTAVSCTCEGFIFSGACSHHSALLAKLGWLPVVESASSPVPCTACTGSGQLWSEGQWSADSCGFCNGAGHVDVVIDCPTNVVSFPVTDDRPAA